LSNLHDELEISGCLASQKNNLLVQFAELGVELLVDLRRNIISLQPLNTRRTAYNSSAANIISVPLCTTSQHYRNNSLTYLLKKMPCDD